MRSHVNKSEKTQSYWRGVKTKINREQRVIVITMSGNRANIHIQKLSKTVAWLYLYQATKQLLEDIKNDPNTLDEIKQLMNREEG